MHVRGVPSAVDGDPADAAGALDGNLDSLWFANCCNMHGDFLMAGCSDCQVGEVWVAPAASKRRGEVHSGSRQR